MLPWAEDVTLTTSDGYDLASWFVPPHPGSDARDQAVLLAHGNGGDASGRAPLARELAERGFAVLMLGYRGYAQNPGTPSEAGLLRDALAGQRELEVRGFPAGQTIYLGESIGTGVVSGLAVEQPPGGLVLRSPFTSLHDVGATLIPVPPLVRFIMDRNHFPVAEQVAASDVPVTVIQGSADEVVPAAQSDAVAAAGNLFEHVVVEGARHNDGIWLGSTVADAVARLGDAIATD
ncbi:alpha/beta hydrolase [Xylanimonas protaetiae]|uniref:alpha/beta hydrolase n=1 Tax=Xylanimonas protaetiae TaxID=2509457 RepID=UPI0013E9B828|nr:alpha/beta fold hydrolase [Xylanimonas protaetiae]